MEVTPANTVLHHWRFDPDYSDSNGRPNILSFDGPNSFATLVKKYAGDIPPGALRTTLIRAGAARERDDQKIEVIERYFYPRDFDEDFMRNAAFALKNLGNTLAYNASLLAEDDSSRRNARLERSAWTEWLSPEASAAFELWVASEGAKFIYRADDWIGKNEVPKEKREKYSPKAVGVGIYYFEEE